MAIVFDSTIGGSAANSYSTVADYNQYRENLGLDSISESMAQVSLIKATSWIDAQYRQSWNTRTKANDDQALHWPQSGAQDYAGADIPKTVIPEQVKKAVYEYAIRSESQTSLDPQQNNNVKRQSLEGLGEQEFFSQRPTGELPAEFSFIDTLLFGLITGKSGGIQFLDMRRA